MESKPYTVMMDIVQGCNRSCSFCGTRGFEQKIYYAEGKTISRECELIKRSSYTPRLFIAGNGEPTLHPDIIKILAIIRSVLPNTWVQLATNGYGIKKYGYAYINALLPYINDLTIEDYDGDIDTRAIKQEIEIYNSTNDNKCEFAILQDGVPVLRSREWEK